jgi:hypothetical protein
MPIKPQPNEPMYPLAELYLFDQYQTQAQITAEYSETLASMGSPIVFMDINRRPKTWWDPAAVEIAKRDREEPVPYKIVRKDKSGKPVVVSITMPAYEAATLNLFSGGTTTEPNDPMAIARVRPPVEVPVRDLLPNEQLSLLPPMNAIVVRRTDLGGAPAPGGGGGFDESDRQRMIRIERMLADVERSLAD